MCTFPNRRDGAGQADRIKPLMTVNRTPQKKKKKKKKLLFQYEHAYLSFRSLFFMKKKIQTKNSNKTKTEKFFFISKKKNFQKQNKTQNTKTQNKTKQDVAICAL